MKVRVTATAKELRDIGVCSQHTMEWLMDGVPKQVTSTNPSEKRKGTDMVYLRGPDDSRYCKLWIWIYSDMCEVVS